MTKPKNKVISCLAILMIVVCLLSIIGTLIVNLLFNGSNATPHLFDYDIYLNTASDMEPQVTANSAVFLTEEAQYVQNDIVLYKAADGNKRIGMISLIVDTTSVETGPAAAVYSMTTATAGAIVEISEKDILGLCKYENHALGRMLLLLTSTLGMILFLILPGVLLLAYIIFRVISSFQDNEDDEDANEYQNVKKMEGQRAKAPKSPLFIPDELEQDDDFAEKKASIAEHFAKKAPAQEGKKPYFDPEESRRTLETAAIRSKKAKLEAARQELEQERAAAGLASTKEKAAETAPTASEQEERAMVIKRAMQQRAEERQRIADAEARTIAASKAKHAETAVIPAQKPESEPAVDSTESITASAPVEAPTAEPADSAEIAAASTPRQRQRPPRRRPMPQPRKTNAQPGMTSFDDLMKKLDEEKSKLDTHE